MRIEAHEAIEYAATCNLPLSTYSGPTEEGRADVSLDEARDIAREDASLIYIDVSTETLLAATTVAPANDA